MNCTIDASVFVSAVRFDKVHYAASRRFLEQVQAESMMVYCPALILPECTAAIARPIGDSALAEELATLIETFPLLHLVALDLPLARRTVQIASRHRLRGADSVYVAVAEIFDATLFSWDAEMLQRGSEVVSSWSPTDWAIRQEGAS